MATQNTSTKLRKPVFVKVEQLQPGTSGHTLVVKVVSSNPITQRKRNDVNYARSARIAECLVGDETGAIIFTARNQQGNAFSSPLLMNQVHEFQFHIGIGIQLPLCECSVFLMERFVSLRVGSPMRIIIINVEMIYTGIVKS